MSTLNLPEHADDCWENQRWTPGGGWDHCSRLPTDRPLWTDRKGTTTMVREAFLLPGLDWRWKGPWQPLANGTEGPEGWYYAMDFTIPTRFCQAKQGKFSFVRRRRWSRLKEQARGLRPSDLTANFLREVIFYGFNGADDAAKESEMNRNHIASLPFVLEHAAAEKKGLLAANTAAAAATSSPANYGATSGDSSASPVSPASGGTQKPGSPSSNWACSTESIISAATSEKNKLGGLFDPKQYADIVRRNGLPQSMRPQFWKLWSGAAMLQKQHPQDYFPKLLEQVKNDKSFSDHGQDINQDVKRTAANHPYFDSGKGQGGVLLQELLFAWQAHTKAEYHQAYSYVAALCLLNSESLEDAFWLLDAVIGVKGIVSTRYLDDRIVDRDVQMLCSLVKPHLSPEVAQRMATGVLDLSLVAYGWLQALLCAHLPLPTACRVFDVLLVEHNADVLVRFAVTFVKTLANDLIQFDDIGSFANFLNGKMRSLHDAEPVFIRMKKESESSPPSSPTAA